MWKVFVTVVLLLLCLVCVVLLLVNGILFAVNRIRHLDGDKAWLRIKRAGVSLVAAGILCAGFVAFTQWTASTPPIRDASGNVQADSISELVQVEINGRKEWISIRGSDRDNPVLLFLAGGPGGTQMAAVRYELAALEEHFVVVNWDQPGSGKSFGAIAQADLTTAIYVEDGHALTRYLCDRFDQEKIYLLGESWGSALGIFMASEAPELYHAVIGTGQMVAFLETEEMDYDLALTLAREAGDTDLVATLERNGPPPYAGSDVTWKSAAYLNYLSGIMARNPEIANGGYNTLRDLGAEEYGMLDKVNYLRGIATTFGHVYPQLYDVDLRETYATLQVPAYFLLGRHDINAPVSLAEDYYDLLDAPDKELVWFEHSGHSPWINEPDLFVQEVLRLTGMRE